MAYTLKALNELRAELDRTNVISSDFKTTIMGWALDVAREAREAEREEARKIDEQVRRNIAMGR